MISATGAGSMKAVTMQMFLTYVDISTDAPLLETIEYIGKLIDEMCELTEELGF